MKFEQLLKDKGLKSTKGRLEILKFISNQNKPIDVNQIYQGLVAKGLKLDPVTIYRALNKLNEVGLVKQVNLREGKLRYEIEGDHHHHLVCKKCKKIEEIYGEWLQKAEELISKKYQFTAVEHALEFFGVCKTCQETYE